MNNLRTFSLVVQVGIPDVGFMIGKFLKVLVLLLILLFHPSPISLDFIIEKFHFIPVLVNVLNFELRPLKLRFQLKLLVLYLETLEMSSGLEHASRLGALPSEMVGVTV